MTGNEGVTLTQVTLRVTSVSRETIDPHIVAFGVHPQTLVSAMGFGTLESTIRVNAIQM